MRALVAKLAHLRWPWWAAVAAWGVVLFMLSANSAPQTGPEFPFKDKIGHCLYFSAGAFCWVLARFAWPGADARPWRAVMWGVVFAAVVGALDEWHQSYTPGRMGNDPGDWLADTAGGVLGGWAAWRFLRMFRRAAGGDPQR